MMFSKSLTCTQLQGGLPNSQLTGKMLRHEDGCQGCHHKFDIGDGHACPLGLFLCLLQHYDVLGNAFGLRVVPMHVGPLSEHVYSLKPHAVCIEEGNDVEQKNFHVEGICIFEFGIPNLVDRNKEELG